jgi:cysteinyl-tRNA synthetase
MVLRLYNTLTKKTEDFKPKVNNTVGIYTCGLTVQGRPHVGHIRAALTRDIIVRWLEHLGYHVVSVENFTDIDDKVIEKQQQSGQDWRMIAGTHIKEYVEACDRLNIKQASFYPRASQHIEEIIELVKVLVDKGYAYENRGDVYFRVRMYKDYGRLSNKTIDELICGVRIEPHETKQDPLDFALWKAAKPGEPYWFSPWGKGRPGWHIECSAMSMYHLKESCDIHTGGEDLIFPHHENEIAQSVAATGKEFFRYWLHTGWVTLSGEKMAKSTGHYFLIGDILKDYAPNVIRLYLLKTHYRTQIEFSKARLDEARAAYLRLLTYLREFHELKDMQNPIMYTQFTEAMNDDLNTSKALGLVFDLVNKGYEKDSAEITQSIRYYLTVLGFAEHTPAEPFDDMMNILREIKQRLKAENQVDLLDALGKDFLGILDELRTIDDVFPRVIGLLLNLRRRLREDKNFELADYIRQRLAQEGIIFDDLSDGTSTYRLEVK